MKWFGHDLRADCHLACICEPQERKKQLHPQMGYGTGMVNRQVSASWLLSGHVKSSFSITFHSVCFVLVGKDVLSSWEVEATFRSVT